MEIQDSRHIRTSCENTTSAPLNAEQKPSSACFRPLTSSENPKRYLHSGMTPRLNDTHSRPRHRGSTNQNVSSSKSKTCMEHDSKLREMLPHQTASKQNVRPAQETPIDGDARERRRVLTSAHRRWRSSDRLNPRIISKDFQESKSSFFQKRVLQITGSKPRLCSEPTAVVFKEENGSSPVIPDLDSIVKSDNEYQSGSNQKEMAEQCEALLSGHPFILQDSKTDHCNAFSNVPSKSARESQTLDSYCKSKISSKTMYYKEGNDGEKQRSKYIDLDDNTTSDDEAKIKSVNSKSLEKYSNRASNNLTCALHSPDIITPEPPKVAKCAWDVGFTEESSVETCSDENADIDPNLQHPSEAQMRPVRHWANIEHRAATRNAALNNSSHRTDSPSAPFVKSKSSWRIHAAKARESVAGLLNISKSKDSSALSPRRLKADAKLRPHHKSSPCLDTSSIQGDATGYNMSSEQMITRRGVNKQTSSPELFDIGGSQNQNAAHTQRLISDTKGNESLRVNEDTTQPSIASSIPLQMDPNRIKCKEDSNASGAFPSTSLTNYTNDFHFERLPPSHPPQDPDDEGDGAEVPSHSAQRCLDGRGCHISEDQCVAHTHRPMLLPEKDSESIDSPVSYTTVEDDSKFLRNKEECNRNQDMAADIILYTSQSQSTLHEETGSDEEISMVLERPISPKTPVGMIRALTAAQNHMNKVKSDNRKSGKECLLSQTDEVAMNTFTDNQIPLGMQTDSDNYDIQMADNNRNCIKVEEKILMEQDISYVDKKDNVRDVQNLRLEVSKEQYKARYDTERNSANNDRHTESEVVKCDSSEETPLLVRTALGSYHIRSRTFKNGNSRASSPEDTHIVRSHNVEEDRPVNGVVPTLTDEDNLCSNESFVAMNEADGNIRCDGILNDKVHYKEMPQAPDFDSFDENKGNLEKCGREQNIKSFSFNEDEVQTITSTMILANACAHVGSCGGSKTRGGGEHQDTLCDRGGSSSSEAKVHDSQIHRQDSTSSVSPSNLSTRCRKGNHRGAVEGGGGGKRERSRRVEHMLNNQVFQKHLAKHADTIERRVFGVGKKGLRKARSNFDLSTDQSDMLGDVMSSIFSFEGSCSNESDGSTHIDTCDERINQEDNSSHKILRCVSLCEKQSASVLNNNPADADDTAPINSEISNKSGRFLRKAASSFLLRSVGMNSPDDPHFLGAKTDRRLSSIGPNDDQKLVNDSHNMHNKRRRMHIPSFSEYKQKKQVNNDPGSSVDPEHYRQDMSIDGIYVIEESEQDVEYQHMNIDSSTDSEKTNTLYSINNSEDHVTGKRGQVAIFSHPAIVITTEHCSQLKNSLWSSETRSSRRKRNTDNREAKVSESSNQSDSPTSPQTTGESLSSLGDESRTAGACEEPQEIDSQTNKMERQRSGVYESKLEPHDGRQNSVQPFVHRRETHETSSESQSMSVVTFPEDQSILVSTNVSNSAYPQRLDLIDEIIPPKTSEVYEEGTSKVDSYSKPSSPANGMNESLGFSINNNTILPQEDTLTFFQSGKHLELVNQTENKATALSKPSCKPLNINSTVNRCESNSSSPTRDMPGEEETPTDTISMKGTNNCCSDQRMERQDSPKEISVNVLQLPDATAYVDDDDVCDDVSRASVTTSRWSPSSSASDSDQSNKTSVLRSTSDVSATLSDEKEKRRRERKERPYKSDPFTGTITRPPSLLSPDTPIQSCLSASTSCSFHSLDELDEQSDTNSLCDEDDTETRKRQNRISTASSASEDSGVSSHGWTDWKSAGGCAHCAAFSLHGASSPSSPSGLEFESLSSIPTSSKCNKCLMRKRERKETIQEMAETEKRYGRDLAILKDEFYRHMKSTSLLTLDQLDAIFMNLDELITVHKHFMSKLTSALVNAVREGDEGFSSVNVGGIFVDSSRMFLAFEHYCVNQSQSSTLLEQLEKEKELLKVFLQAAQNENAKMRRMHLKTFLMVPVQRVMKYPLLLGRLYRVTPCYHGDKTNIRQARDNIEDILEQINSKTQTSRPKNRSLQIQGYSLSEKIEVNRAALDVLGWSKKEVCDIVTSRLWYGQVPDHTWASKRARNVKFSMVHAALLSHGRPTDSPFSPRDPPQVLQVAMVLVREKGGKYQLVREPLLMDRCVMTVDPEYDHVFEVHEQGKDTYLFKAETRRETNTWAGHLRQLSRHLGYWRRRRNGLPNVLLKTT